MRFGYTQGSHYWVRLYQYLAKLLNVSEVKEGIQCDVFFYTYWNVKDAMKCTKNTKLVFISGECWDVSKFPCSILIDCKFTSKHQASRFFYYPFYALSFFERPSNINETNLIKPANYTPHQILAQKTKFCAFMYSYNVDFRVQLFDDICTYKQVDGLGKSRNTTNQTDDRNSSLWLQSAVKKYMPYKFVICCENTCVPGYVTEKIINAMLANAIPIYLGAQDISDHFNTQSFINIASFASRADAIKYIRKIDQDDQLYISILTQPWFKNNTLPSYFLQKSITDAFLPLINKQKLSSSSSMQTKQHRTQSINTPLKHQTNPRQQQQQHSYKLHHNQTLVKSPRQSVTSPRQSVSLQHRQQQATSPRQSVSLQHRQPMTSPRQSVSLQHRQQQATSPRFLRRQQQATSPRFLRRQQQATSPRFLRRQQQATSPRFLRRQRQVTTHR